MCNEACVPVDCKVSDIFRDLIPAELERARGQAPARAAAQQPLPRLQTATFVRQRAARLAGPTEVHLCLSHTVPDRQHGEGGGCDGKAAVRDLPPPP